MRRSASLVVLLTIIFACGGKGNSFGNGDGGESDSSLNPDAPKFGFDAGNADSGSGGCTQCSADLHEVLTCGDNPQVVQTCTGNQGCGPNGCIDACDAAAANKSSIGCDYYAIPADGWSTTWNSGGAAGNCFAAFVTNNWSSNMNVTLVWKGQTINGNNFAYLPQGSGSAITYQKIPTTGIPPNSMAIVFLNDYVPGQGELKCNCPSSVQAAVSNEDMVIHQTSVSHAIEIKTDVPAVVYDIYPYGGATSYISSATLLLPVTAWDTNYVATTMSDYSGFPPAVDFIAQQDGTAVTVLPTTNIIAGSGVAAATKNSPVTYNINKGETIHIMQAVDGSGLDLTGSIVQSNVPIGVWGEHFCEVANSPPPWRMVGAVDGTTLTYDPPISGAPATIKEGQLVEFNATPGAFHVVSQDAQHPFYLAAHRPGGDCDAAHQQIPPIKALGNEYVAVANEATNYGVGGPETVNVVPPAQFLPSYIFFTDPSYGYTEIALTRVKAADNTFHDVNLDCLGNVSGWQAVGTSGKYQYVHVDLRNAQQKVGNCDNGLHTIKSDVPFGITVWGYDSASSYAYPAGASVKPINTVVVPPTPH